MSTVPSAPTGLTQLAEVINTEYISRQIELAAIDPLIGERIVMRTVLDPAVVNSYTYQIVTGNEMTGAAVVTPHNEAPEDAWEPTSDTISGVRIGLSSFVPDSSRVTIVNTANAVIAGLTHAVRDMVHDDILDLFANADNSAGDATTEFDLAFWAAQTIAFNSQLPDPGERHAVLHAQQQTELRADLMSSAAALFGASWGDRAAAGLGTTQVGAGVPFDGYNMHIALDVPAGDTTGHTAALLVRNDGGHSALELVVWEPLSIAMKDERRRYGTWLVAGAILGVGIRSQKNLRALITQPAA
jgi:hypothetical protein